MKYAIATLALLATFLALPLMAQAPPTLPGYSVSISAGYSLLTGAQNNNGFFSSVAVPLWTSSTTNTFNLAARADYFSIATPSTYFIGAGPEARFQFSKASFFGGKVFQPFGNVMVGAARSNCSAGSAVTCNGDAKVGWKLGGGLDMIMNSTLTARLFEVDYIHSTIFPGNSVVLSNFAQVTSGIGIRF